MKNLLIFGMTLMSTPDLTIVTIDSPRQEVLKRVSDEISADELPLAKEIADTLYRALEPHFPAAGLAAPQIGISKAVFIYSYDRDPQHLEVVINPTLEPVGDSVIEGWEACFSAILCDGAYKVAKVPRYEKISVSYWDIDGNVVNKVLDGFAAKVFQHEYDHLQGIENVNRPDALVQTFENKEKLTEFMIEVKKQDAKRYKKS